MSKVLYRKYRPKRLNEVVGQEQVTSILEKSISVDNISHAYLFIGPRGTGKTSVARIFAHQINNFDYEIEDNYVDIIEIDGASNRGIDDIRELREKALISPTMGKYKVYIIDEVHMLTKEAFNALLKILEEPPKHVVFIMATTDAYKIPVTISSRAQTYTFKLADEATMLNYLDKICKKENIKIEEDALKIIAKRGGGSFRDSLSLLGQISTLSDEKITKDSVIKAMGLPEDSLISDLLDRYLDGNNGEIVGIFKSLVASGVKPEIIAEEMISQIIEKGDIRLFDLLGKLPEVRAPFPDAKLLSILVLNNRNTENSKPDDNVQPIAAKLVAKELKPVNNDPTTFSWDEFLEKVKGANDAIYSQLKKSNYYIEGETLNIVPPKKIIKTILSKDGNLSILRMLAGRMKVMIKNPEDNFGGTLNDGLISKISDIMGGEVKNDQGGNPF